jgi:SNF2 family DNA or RNA helicase
LAIVDEAHKLRNVYRKSARTAADVRDALAGTKKLLLTATPFQNSLMELYGLTTVIDPNFFGSEKTFRRDYGNGENIDELRFRKHLPHVGSAHCLAVQGQYLGISFIRPCKLCEYPQYKDIEHGKEYAESNGYSN